MGKQHNRRIFAGYYKRYDDKLVYVVTVAKDADTGEPIVIFHYDTYSEKIEYLTMTKRCFCEMVEIRGTYVDKFTRQTQKRISDWKVRDLHDDGFVRPKKRKKLQLPPDEDYRFCRYARTYESYAKDLCDNYFMDVRRYNLCVEQKQYIGIFKEDFLALKEDLFYIKACMKTVLREYNQYFRERYYERKSIRKYAADHNLNRGSVEHIQRKFMSAFIAALKQRDEADGQCRLNQSPIDK